MSVQANGYPLPVVQPALAALVPCARGAGCPLGVDAPAVAHALRAGDHQRGYQLARGPNPFPASCGHGCHAPCEQACRRRYFGAPVAIAALEAYAAGYAVPALAESPGPCTSAHDARAVAGLVNRSPAAAVRAPRSGLRVAVIGAGVAGLACAHDLTLLGHTAALFDAAHEPGGLLTAGLPAFRFPTAGARAECAAVLAMGVVYHGDYRVEGSGDLRALLAGEFDAVFLGIGASDPHEPMFAAQPEHAHVVDAMRTLSEDVRSDPRTVVAGDGDLAIDAARVVLRRAIRDGMVGATVHLVLETPLDRSQVPPDALGAALTEGIVVHAGWRATRYAVDEATAALRGVEIAHHAGRLRKLLPCSRIITAGARAPRSAPFAPELAIDGDGYVVVDPETLRTSMPGVWAGGACAHGHRSIAHATADGKRAAWQIHAALTGRAVRVTVASAWVEVDDWDPARAGIALATPRLEPAAGPPPADPFSTAALRPGADVAREATRCFDCSVLPVVDDRCTSCGACVKACPEGAFSLMGDHPRQLRLDQDVCTRCGICVGHCPEGAIAMLRAVWEERLTTGDELPDLADVFRLDAPADDDRLGTPPSVPIVG